MNDFFPFIYNPKKKDIEPEPLYIEIAPPTEAPKKDEKPNQEDPKEERGVVIIQL